MLQHMATECKVLIKLVLSRSRKSPLLEKPDTGKKRGMTNELVLNKVEATALPVKPSSICMMQREGMIGRLTKSRKKFRVGQQNWCYHSWWLALWLSTYQFIRKRLFLISSRSADDADNSIIFGKILFSDGDLWGTWDWHMPDQFSDATSPPHWYTRFPEKASFLDLPNFPGFHGAGISSYPTSFVSSLFY